MGSEGTPNKSATPHVRINPGANSNFHPLSKPSKEDESVTFRYQTDELDNIPFYIIKLLGGTFSSKNFALKLAQYYDRLDVCTFLKTN